MITERLTRLAPTPSGFLHQGNLLNFLLVQRVAHEVDAAIALRIDDMDVFRMRDEYVHDIFRCLDWLQINWQFGPQHFDAYADLPSVEERADHYYDMLQTMVSNGLPAFVCKCSRRELGRDARCEAGCVDSRLRLQSGKNCVRVRVPEEAMEIRAAMGDFVVWRREDLPAYQLASLVDDHEMGVTHIVRGEDLRQSTATQRWMAQYLANSPFLTADIRHHALLTGDKGVKLSKSQGTQALDLTPGLLVELRELASSVALERFERPEVDGIK